MMQEIDLREKLQNRLSDFFCGRCGYYEAEKCNCEGFLDTECAYAADLGNDAEIQDAISLLQEKFQSAHDFIVSDYSSALEGLSFPRYQPFSSNYGYYKDPF